MKLEESQFLKSLRILICVVAHNLDKGGKKDVPSTSGMKLSVETSEMLDHRIISGLADIHIKNIENAIMSDDFPSFAKEVCRESNQLHAICLDTSPPIFY
jgi:diphosphomevalonate decarboxylase